MATYEEQDPTNTNRISKTMFQQMLFRYRDNQTLHYCPIVRLGFLHTEDDIVSHIWSKLLKNKDGSVDPHELIRHFAEPLAKNSRSG